MRSFASDNYAKIHPAILKGMIDANVDHERAYGDDIITPRAVESFRREFSRKCEVFFVFNGTAANVLGLSAITSSFNSILTAQSAHINTDECGAVEKFTGCKLQTVESRDGKLRPEDLEPFLLVKGICHRAQPKVISITQPTEYGTLYSLLELKALSEFAKRHSLYFHMDGARLANAAASLGCPLGEISADAGVDVLSFGGTKNGMMCGEAVLFFNPELADSFTFIRKQGMQLASKMRFIAAQFEVLLTDKLWLKNASHANKMAKKLAEALSQFPRIQLTQPVEANSLFALIPFDWIAPLQERYPFYVWNLQTKEVRWMTSFDTTEEEVDDFVEAIRALNKI